MNKKSLDIPVHLYQVPVEHNQSTGWQDVDLRSWLASHELADWAKDWVRQLWQRFDGDFAKLFGQALSSNRMIPDWMSKGAPKANWLIQFLRDDKIAQIWFEQGFLVDDPAWLKQLLDFEKAKVARSFLLNGNISDYALDPVYGYRPTIRVLIDALQKKKDCVLSYRLSSGLCLHTDNDELFDKLPDCVQKELDSPSLPTHAHQSLQSETCRLFELLSDWLMNNDEQETQALKNNFPRGVAIVFENVHLLIPPNNDDIERNYLIDSILKWSSSPELFQSSHCLLLLAESLDDVSNELRAGGGKIEQITLPRPETAKARLKFLLPLLTPEAKMRETRVVHLPHGLDLSGYQSDFYNNIKRLSHDTAGLSLLGIEDLVQSAAMGKERCLDRQTVMKLKRERLRQESDGLLEVIDPHVGLDSIGGYDSLKDRLTEIIRALEHADDKLICSTIPMGILFLGPPGTGKSVVAQALAAEAKNFSMAKLGDFRGMYVGQSERNLSRIFNLIESLYPVIIFIDEIDQTLGSRSSASGDGGVDSRIFARFLEFMSNPSHRGKILWVGASNYPDKIDTAMKRAGRFDLVLPFLLPETSDRQSIIKTLLEKKLGNIAGLEHDLSEQDFATLANQTTGFSGAELEAIVGEALRRVARNKAITGKMKVINVHLFTQILDVYQPPAGLQQDYQNMEQLAVAQVSFVDLLPLKYQSTRASFDKS